MERTTPMLSSKRNVTRYGISDPLFAFCYGTLYRFPAPDDDDEADAVLRNVMDRLSTYDGKVFETVCRQYVRKYLGYSSVGTWWGQDPTVRGRRTDADIDIVAMKPTESGAAVLFGECKCRDQPVGTDMLGTLEEKAGQFPVEKRFVLFSTGGFTDELMHSGREDVLLVGLKELFSFLEP